MTIVIGVDPGTKYTGWGVIDSELNILGGGCISTNSKDNMVDRLYELHLNLNIVIDKYSPDEAAIEKNFLNSNPKTSIIAAQTIGAILLTLRIHNIKIFYYEPTLIKKAITGNGHATKDQVKYMVNSIFKDKVNSEKYDMYDALAIALCHAHSS